MAVQIFWEVVHTRVTFFMWVSLLLADLPFLRVSFLESDLSTWMDEKRNFVPCPNDAGMQRFVKVGGRAFTQADLKLIVTCVLQSYQNTETFSFHSELSLAISWFPVCMYIKSISKVLYRNYSLFADNVIPNVLAKVYSVV